MSQRRVIGDKTYTLTTLCLLTRGDPTRQCLLGYKKSGFGKGKYSGFGGKVEAGENIAAAAARELFEETGLRVAVTDLHSAGRLAFWFPYKPEWSQLVYIYTARNWLGEPVESDEMIPSWFSVDQIPYQSMWQDGSHWLPPVLAGQHVQADFVFCADNEAIESVNLVLCGENKHAI